MLRERDRREQRARWEQRDRERIDELEWRTRDIRSRDPDLVEDRFTAWQHIARHVVENVRLRREVTFHDQLTAEWTVIAAAVARNHNKTVSGIRQSSGIRQVRDVADPV